MKESIDDKLSKIEKNINKINHHIIIIESLLYLVLLFSVFLGVLVVL